MLQPVLVMYAHNPVFSALESVGDWAKCLYEWYDLRHVPECVNSVGLPVEEVQA